VALTLVIVKSKATLLIAHVKCSLRTGKVTTEDTCIIFIGKLHNEELHDLYSSPSRIRIIKSRRMRWANAPCSTNGAKKNAYRLLVGKPEGRRPLGRPRRRSVDNIGMDLVEAGWDGVDWIGLAQDRESSCEFGIEPSGSI
jgi:hypothetical protein